MPNWLLPDYVSDVLPSEALRVERLRRALLDHYAARGYQYFIPPLLEYVESLRVQGADDLERRSFKLTDPGTGRLLSLRPDITPQAVRVDAHLMDGQGINRLCYAASAVLAVPSGVASSRESFQVGCELFGEEGLAADLEIQSLALESLRIAGLQAVHLNLSDRGVLAALKAQLPELEPIETEVIQALASKDAVALRLATQGLDSSAQAILLSLLSLYGPPGGEDGVVARARRVLPGCSAMRACLDRLEAVSQSAVFSEHPRCQLSLDLADLQGWRYHNGLMFSVYASGHPDALLRGGRYDGMGEAFGRARPATGFSLELRALASLTE
jgi:ATP phosphoribosyltransferase regulatory subunit